MSTIDPAARLGELVAQRPARAPVFERLRLDYCCGGRQTLAAACTKRGLELDTVRTALEAIDASSVDRQRFESKDWRRVSIAELCTHIVAVHHDSLREALPRIETLLGTVVRVHGDGHPELRNLQRAFAGIRAELEPHLASEESELFPASLALEQCGAVIEEALLDEHEREHTSIGDGLATLRILGGDYDPPDALCSTHGVLLDALATFELDLHQHIHEENNILLPRVRELNAAAQSHLSSPSTPTSTTNPEVSQREGAEQGESLPACCRAWIAEQTRAWGPTPR
jgi:regulator of cell morphogenesis and NO signaling